MGKSESNAAAVVTHNVTPIATPATETPQFRPYTPMQLADLIKTNRATGKGSKDGIRCFLKVTMGALSWYELVASAMVLARLPLVNGTIKAKLDSDKSLYIGE